jgi:hypothetical protein
VGVTRPSPLPASREQILAFRRRVGSLDERMPPGRRSLERAAFAGLQDSMPRAAVLSIHARVRDTRPSTWEDPALVQLWGPRYSAYVVAAKDVAVFSLGRYPDDAKGRRVADDLAARLDAYLAGRRMGYGDAGDGIGLPNANALRYAATTGTVLIRWEGARRPLVWTVPPPAVSAGEARLELARRFLHVFGPTTPEAFAAWAGISAQGAASAFVALERSLASVRTPIGDAWILARDEAAVRSAPGEPADARLLPSGDPYYLLQGRDRALVVPNARRRDELWTSRVWPGAVLVRGEVVGTWRRSQHVVRVDPWRRLRRDEMDAVEREAVALPLPDLRASVVVRWDGA